MRFIDLDCVTIDAFGTLVSLVDPVLELDRRLREHGVEREPAQIDSAIRGEIDYYRKHALRGRDRESLSQLRLDCCGVFLDPLSTGLYPIDFVSDFLDSIRFRVEPGAAEALKELRGKDLKLAVVSNWDCSLGQRLANLGLKKQFDLIAASATVGVEKPDPRIFRYVLDRLSVAADRALHIGDSEDDRVGALAAGVQFAWAPLEAALEGIG
jgi:putative hydrolase of the HAD superfamily